MVDKSSLRSNKRSDSKDAKKSTDSKQPAKSSSRKAAVKKSTSGNAGEIEDDKPLDNGAEDVDMNDDTQDSTATAALETKKAGGDGDVEMDDGKTTENDGKVTVGGGEDKKEEAQEDPAIVVINGNQHIVMNFTGFDQLMVIIQKSKITLTFWSEP